MSLDQNKTYLVWNGTEFPNSTSATFKAPAGSTIDWGDGTVETFDAASETVNKHTYTDGKTEHTIAISGLTSIGNTAFFKCGNLTSITIGNSVKSIGNSSFLNCSNLTRVTIHDNTTSIGFDAFSGCSKLTSITIPDSVTSIGNSAFSNCSSLTSVTIGNGITSINDYAFNPCSKLTQLILFQSEPPTLVSNAIPTNISKIYVPKSSKAAYQVATNWTKFASKIVWDNIYTSFVRFNRKNKEYINGKVDELSTKVAPILSDYVDDTLLGG